MKQVRTHHSKEFKIKAVELCKQNGNIAVTSKELTVIPVILVVNFTNGVMDAPIAAT